MWEKTRKVSVNRVFVALRKKGLSPDKIKDIIHEAQFGSERMLGAKPIVLKRLEVKRLLKKLNETGIVVLRKIKSNPSHFEFVSPTRVTIKERKYNFDNPEIHKRALERSKEVMQNKTFGVQAGV